MSLESKRDRKIREIEKKGLRGGNNVVKLYAYKDISGIFTELVFKCEFGENGFESSELMEISKESRLELESKNIDPKLDDDLCILDFFDRDALNDMYLRAPKEDWLVDLDAEITAACEGVRSAYDDAVDSRSRKQVNI